jgi:magnesium chelatase family protein
LAIGRTHAVSLLGLRGAIVEIEADISANLPNFVLIGLPDAALGEARDRVRAAATNSGVGFPHQKVTVNLSPAALPKHGSGFDLAIALATLAADGAVEPASIDRVVHLGELGLDGRLRPSPAYCPRSSPLRPRGSTPSWCPSATSRRRRSCPACGWSG